MRVQNSTHLFSFQNNYRILKEQEHDSTKAATLSSARKLSKNTHWKTKIGDIISGEDFLLAVACHYLRYQIILNYFAAVASNCPKTEKLVHKHKVRQQNLFRVPFFQRPKLVEC